MEQHSKHFTLDSEIILKELITPLGVSIPFNPLDSPHPVVTNTNGLWDTGATGTVISKKLAKELNLKPTGIARVNHANGVSDVNVYHINLYLPNQVMFPFIKVTEGVLPHFDILIGMDIISCGDFSISNFGNKTTFCFRIPSIKKTDFGDEIKHVNKD